MILKDLCNEFLTYKKHLVETGELTARTHQDYHDTCERLLSILGRNIVVEEIRPDDLLKVRDRLSSTLGPVALSNEIGRVRVLFNYAYAEERIEKPVRFGKTFRKPSKRAIRQHKAQRETTNGKKFFEAVAIRRLLDAADVHMRAMIYLGANCGFGNADCGKLPTLAMDLDGAWITFPRPKTGIARRCKLWRETVEALRESLANRTAPKDEKHGGLVFVTKYGQPWFKDSSSTNPVSQQFRKLLVAAGQYRDGIGFYALRHTFETVAGETKDQVAVNHVMGHVDESMAGEYREHISDARLQAVADHVHGWLFGTAPGKRTKGSKARDAAPVASQEAEQAPVDDRLLRAMQRARAAIAAATGETRRCLESVWNRQEFELAEKGEWLTVRRFVEVWGDDRSQGQADDRPKLRVVGA
jgi:integrase